MPVIRCKSYYLVFDQRARPIEARAIRLYLKTKDPRVLAEAQKEIARLANEAVRQLPGRHCEGATCVLTEWQRIVVGFEELAGKDRKSYQDLLAKVEVARRRLPARSQVIAERLGRTTPYLSSRALLPGKESD